MDNEETMKQRLDRLDRELVELEDKFDNVTQEDNHLTTDKERDDGLDRTV